MTFSSDKGYPFAPSETTIAILNKLRRLAKYDDVLLQKALIVCVREGGRVNIDKVAKYIIDNRKAAIDAQQKEYFHNIEGYEYDV